MLSFVPVGKPLQGLLNGLRDIPKKIVRQCFIFLDPLYLREVPLSSDAKSEKTSMPTTPKRLTISITNGAVDDIELLRSKLEKRLKQRLSIAQVMKRLTIHALKAEQEIEADIERLSQLTKS